MLARLRLFEFRCHPRIEWEPAPGRNDLVGANGRGKTSILEAIYTLSRLRSFRTGQPRELARWPGHGFALEAVDRHEGKEERLALKWEDGAREWSVDGDKTVPLSQFWGRLPTVLFSSEDGALVRGPAAKRQAWLDSLRSAAAPAHLVAVQRYNAVLKQRNAWLRQGALDPAVGEVLTAQLLAQGAIVTGGRLLAAEAAARHALPLLEKFFGGAAVCRFSYRPSLKPGAEAEIDWPRLAPLERRQQRTLVGPHRDEWELAWNGKSVARYGSEGEQRLAALLLRLIEAAHLREARGRWPVFLIDDALTPLDPARKLTLEALLPPEAQVIQAGTVAPACPGPGNAVWSVGSGEIRPFES